MFTQPSLLNKMYCGTSVTCVGSISVTSIVAYAIRRPMKFSRANANAARLQENTLPMIASTEMNSEFSMKMLNAVEMPFQPSA